MNAECMLSPHEIVHFGHCYYAVDQRIDFDLICINFDEYLFFSLFFFDYTEKSVFLSWHVEC